jgi:O-antigen/teichoic acid export membrane protein
MSDAGGPETRTYGRNATLLTGAIGAAGLFTYLFFALASHTLDKVDYGELVVLWSAVFIAVSTLFRPVEQLLSRTIAELEAHGERTGHALRVAGLIQLALALAFVVVALALREPLEDDLLGGEETLYWVMIAAVTAFGASFYARGMLAGSRRFAFYAVLLLVDGFGRFAFAFAVAVGISESPDVVALGVAVGPALSLLVVPVAFLWRRPAPRSIAGGGPAGDGAAGPDFTLAKGSGFAAAVLMIMLSEQVFLNGGPLIVRGAEGAAAAGYIFNVLMVARAPVVLFQAVAASLLPHLTRLRSRGGEKGAAGFRASVTLTTRVLATLAALATLVMAIGGPELMQVAFGDKFEYDRVDLVIVAVGMGFYLCAGTFNQAALAQGQARRAAACWVLCAIGFVLWNLAPAFDVFLRVEIGFTGAAALLCGLLFLLYRHPRPEKRDEVEPDSPREIELRLAAGDEAT